MNWKPDGDDIHINVPPIRMGSTNPGATGWWLIKDHSGSRSAVPHDHTILCEESASMLLGTTYLAADVIRFIIAGTLPCQLTGTEDGHG